MPGRVAFHQSFDGSEDLFEQQGVGTGPAAPDAAPERGDHKQEESKPGEDEEGEPQILGDEGDPEKVKATMGNVEEHSGVAADVDPWKDHGDQQQEQSDNGAGPGEASTHMGRTNEPPGSVRIDRGNGIQIG
ncbi:MAG: hypothetical protein BWY82_01966 [Verrucomicrobia bacterium ADurb.Bin474]|nr:MAG: hypothetical protein BWY82_01966 [Verrucomicrobia bacterium ADurb.Bin474]